MKKTLLSILLATSLIFGQSFCDEKFSQKTDRFSATNIEGNLAIQVVNGSPVVSGNYTFDYPNDSDKKEGVEDGSIEQTVCYLCLYFETEHVYVALYPDKETYRPAWSKLFISSPYEPSTTKLAANWYMSADKAKALIEKGNLKNILVTRVVFENK